MLGRIVYAIGYSTGGQSVMLHSFHFPINIQPAGNGGSFSSDVGPFSRFENWEFQMAVQGKPQFLPRDAYAVTVPSQDVRLSVCPSHAVIESKLLYISSECFHCRVAPPV